MLDASDITWPVSIPKELKKAHRAQYYQDHKGKRSSPPDAKISTIWNGLILALISNLQEVVIWGTRPKKS